MGSEASLEPRESGGVVRRELENVLSSETFAQAESLKRFLRHIVETTLSGRQDEIKEIALGAEVFDRGTSYDPRIDPIVRVQATRLRSKLRDYYQTEGVSSEIVIELPKGSYVPVFQRRLEAAPVEAPPLRRWLVLLPVGLAVVALVALLWLPETPERKDVPAEIQSIAVLPFTDMSPGRDQEHLGEGIADDITTTLASVPGLSVVPRTSAFGFKGSAEPLDAIATKLGADAVLQGSVRRSGDRMRVSAQLIRAADNQQIWTETYEKPATEAFEVQDGIARSVVGAVEKGLVSSRGSADAPHPEAYEQYLRGVFERERSTEAAIARSIYHFERAINLDPDFARAYAGLVQSYVVNVLWGFSAPDETRELARHAAERAMSLSEDRPEAVAAAAAYHLIYEWDLERTEETLARPVPGPPNEAIQIIDGLLSAARGELESAAEHFQKARVIGPHSPVAHYLGALLEFDDGRPREALATCRSLLEWAPEYPLCWLLEARASERLGDLDRAYEALDELDRRAGKTTLGIATRAVVYARGGREKEARDLLRQLREEPYVPPPFLARVHAALGEVEAALDELERVSREKSVPIFWLELDPDFEPLRDHPRYRALIVALGLQ